jgi:hypothetical protein
MVGIFDEKLLFRCLRMVYRPFHALEHEPSPDYMAGYGEDTVRLES